MKKQRCALVRLLSPDCQNVQGDREKCVCLTTVHNMINCISVLSYPSSCSMLWMLLETWLTSATRPVTYAKEKDNKSLLSFFDHEYDGLRLIYKFFPPKQIRYNTHDRQFNCWPKLTFWNRPESERDGLARTGLSLQELRRWEGVLKPTTSV